MWFDIVVILLGVGALFWAMRQANKLTMDSIRAEIKSILKKETKEIRKKEYLPKDYEKYPLYKADGRLHIKIKYFDSDLPRIEKMDKGDWIDLRFSMKSPGLQFDGECVLDHKKGELRYKKGTYMLLPLGVAMQLPDGYEANTVPRSSTFKKYGFIQVNSPSVIDNSYKGDNDQWFYPVYALKDGVLKNGDRICQFRLNKKMDNFSFVAVNRLEGEDRGGFGSTGVK